MQYTLMHKNKPVLDLEIDDDRRKKLSEIITERAAKVQKKLETRTFFA